MYAFIFFFVLLFPALLAITWIVESIETEKADNRKSYLDTIPKFHIK